MEITSAEFIISNSRADMCPKTDLPEYAFIGRSNVGKSSLINMLTNQPKLAMTSATPGKTLLINHFLINKEWYLVDLPGYGYAQRGKKMMEKIQKLIEYYVVQDKESALQQVSKWMGRGLEGGVLKDFNYQFKNGTSKLQLKIKLKVDTDLRITGFTEGTLGTKREGKIGAIQYQNDEGTVQGQCSGFSDAELEYFTTHKEELLGKILTVEFCDVVKSPENDYYALMHPRFKGIRTDKTETDTLERILEMRDMARSL